MDSSVSVIIAAAGSSIRMGTPKALLKHHSGTSFARYLLNCFGLYGCKPVTLVAHAEIDIPEIRQGSHQMVVNRQSELGRSYSIQLGLQNVPAGSACFIHNVDNPFLSPELLDELVKNLNPDAYTVPVYHGTGGHPVLLGERVVKHLQSLERLTDFRELLGKFNRIEVPWPDESPLLNINTPEDYQRYHLNMI